MWHKRLRLAFLSRSPKQASPCISLGSADLGMPNPEPVYGKAGRITDLDKYPSVEGILQSLP